ncbi:MAG: hypothetical protein ACI81L_002731, partial [Verrucomicrobiales bacterium]
MRHRILIATFVVSVALLVACTSSEGPNLATEASTADDGVTESDGTATDTGVPEIDDARGGTRSLAGTTWAFEEAFGLGSANHPQWVTFYAVAGELRMDYGSDCGAATRKFVPTVDGLQFTGDFDRSGRSTCEDLDSLFGYQAAVNIDDRGRLVIREVSRRNPMAVRFTHVQSTSIQSDPVPEQTEGERTAILIGRSRWIATDTTGVVEGSDLEQSVGFVSVSGNADVVSFFAGCRGASREISWNDDASFTVGDPFQFDSVGMGER